MAPHADSTPHADHADHASHTGHTGHAGHASHASQPDHAGHTGQAGIAAQAVPPGTIYTCPMHPEIRQDHPGNCPKCGMTLEPLLPALDDGDDNPELRDFQRRFWWTLPFTLAVATLAMAGHGLAWFHGATQNWIEFGLTLPVALWAGWPFYVRGV